MMMAAELSHRLGWLVQAEVERAAAIIAAAGLPLAAPAAMSVEDFLARMRLDKKNVDQRLRLILLQALGQAVVYDETPPTLLDELLESFPRA